MWMERVLRRAEKEAATELSLVEVVLAEMLTARDRLLGTFE